MLQAIYCSHATCEFSTADLLALLEKARARNFRRDISGMLIFDRGMFMQVIEGPKKAIEKLLDVLRRDPRHDEMRILSTRPVTRREFGDWSMAFFHADHVVAEGYLDASSLEADLADANSLAGQMLTLFKDGLFRSDDEAAAGSIAVTITSGSDKLDRFHRQYLVNLGNAIASAMPDVPVTVETGLPTPMTFNNTKRNLDLGEIELF